MRNSWPSCPFAMIYSVKLKAAQQMVIARQTMVDFFLKWTPLQSLHGRNRIDDSSDHNDKNNRSGYDICHKIFLRINPLVPWLGKKSTGHVSSHAYKRQKADPSHMRKVRNQ